MTKNVLFCLIVIFVYLHNTANGMHCFIQQIKNDSTQQINLTQSSEGKPERILSIDTLSIMILPPEDCINLPYSTSKYTHRTTQLKLFVKNHDDLVEIVYDLYYTVKIVDADASLVIVYLNGNCLTIEIPSSQLFGTEKFSTLNIPLTLIINEIFRPKLERLEETTPSKRQTDRTT